MKHITHINHSSIAVFQDQAVLLTDPWYFVNAFHGWAPFPQPDFSLVSELIENTSRRKIVIISHAHDDHVDPLFLRRLHPNDVVVCPRLPNKRFRDRLVDSTSEGVLIIEASEDPVRLSGYEITCVCNNTLSKQDFIFLIMTQNSFIIHANDNWHRFSREVLSHIDNKISRYQLEDRYIFAQIGIADSFPTFYQGYCDEEKVELVRDKCKRMASAVVWNARRCQISKIYAYANQSIFERSLNKSFDPYSIRDQVITDYQEIKQLHPSSTIDADGSVVRSGDYTPLIERRLQLLTNEFNKYLTRRKQANNSHDYLEVSFICNEVHEGCLNHKNSISLTASLHQWNRILSGDCNLESIVTGGCGDILMPREYNMHYEYDALVDWAYAIQSRASKGELFI